MADFKETCMEFLDVDPWATFCSSERKWINKILKLQGQYPNDVEIVCLPEDNGGVILAHLPKTWMKISPPKKVTLTEEQKALRAERMRQVRQKPIV